MDSGYEEIWWKKKKFLCPTKKIPRRLRSSQGDYLSSDVAQPHFFPPPFLVINPLARTHPFCGEFFRGIRTNSTPKFFPSWNLYLCGMKRLVLVGRRSKTRMRSTFTCINSSDKKKTRCCVRVEEKSSLMEMFIDMLWNRKLKLKRVRFVFERVCVYNDKKLELRNLLTYLKRYFTSYYKLEESVIYRFVRYKKWSRQFARILTSIDHSITATFRKTLLQTRRYETIPGCEMKRHTMLFRKRGII